MSEMNRLWKEGMAIYTKASSDLTSTVTETIGLGLNFGGVW